MENAEKVVTAAEMSALKEAIRQTYETYHALDRDTFPAIDFNTNRANYEPLRASFEHEFYKVRGIDRTSANIHIPSTNTLALLFTDTQYRPGKKILNTCRSYANLKSTADKTAMAGIDPPPATSRRTVRWVNLLGLVLLIGATYAMYTAITQSNENSRMGKLTIQQPSSGQVVSRLTWVAGKATTSGEVWLVVHPVVKGDKFYIQDVVPVNPDGTWRGQITVGTPNPVPTDVAFDVRAFVNPRGTYRAFTTTGTTLFDAWPEEAELATGSVRVIRKANTR